MTVLASILSYNDSVHILFLRVLWYLGPILHTFEEKPTMLTSKCQSFWTKLPFKTTNFHLFYKQLLPICLNYNCILKSEIAVSTYILAIQHKNISFENLKSTTFPSTLAVTPHHSSLFILPHHIILFCFSFSKIHHLNLFQYARGKKMLDSFY